MGGVLHRMIQENELASGSCRLPSAFPASIHGLTIPGLLPRADSPHLFGFFFVHDQASATGNHVVSQYRDSTYPFAFSPCSRHLVARTFADQLPLELRIMRCTA